MNDLAEKALAGLDVARRQVRDHPMTSFGVTGFLVSAAVVVSGARVAAAEVTRPLTAWLDLLPTESVTGHAKVAASLMLAAIVVLIGLWLVVVEFVRRRAIPAARVWRVAVTWAVPFAVGPPLLDTAVYGYAGYGLLQRSGYDPYLVGPAALGGGPVVSAVDPADRGVPSAHGPLATALQHTAVSISAGSALGAVVAWRILGVVVAIWIGRTAADLADVAGRPRASALALTVLNPLVLLYVVSAAHLDGALVALLLTALLMAAERRWLLAVVFVSLAASLSAQAFVALPLLVLAHCLVRQRTPVWQRAGRDVLVAAAVIGGLGFAVPNGFGWIAAVSKQFSAHTPFSVAGGISAVLDPVVRGASYDDLAIGGRITVVIAMGCAVGYLIATAARRPLAESVGLALLAIALLAPVLNAWYLLWGPLCLAPTAGTPLVRRVAVLALCAAGCVLTPPGFPRTVSYVLTGLLLVIIAVVAAVVLRRDADASSRAVTATG